MCAQPRGATPPRERTAGATLDRELSTRYVLPYRVPSARPNAGLEDTLLGLLNRARRDAHLAPLAPDAVLRTVARQQAEDMFAFGYLSHRSRDGRSPWDRMAGAGVHPRYAGENLAYAPDVATAHALLMHSPDHRENILSRDYRRVGIGVQDGGARGVVVVEDFTD